MHPLHWCEKCILYLTVHSMGLRKGGMPPVLIHRRHASLALAWAMLSVANFTLGGVMQGRHASCAYALVPCLSCIGMRCVSYTLHMHLQSRVCFGSQYSVVHTRERWYSTTSVLEFHVSCCFLWFLSVGNIQPVISILGLDSFAKNV